MFNEEYKYEAEVDVVPHFWKYCVVCRSFVVVCAYCGNFTCNGTNNENCPDHCATAYVSSEKAFDAIRAIHQIVAVRRGKT